MGIVEEIIAGALFEFFLSVIFSFNLAEKNIRSSDKKSFFGYLFALPVVIAGIVFTRFYYSVLIIKVVVLVSKSVPVFLISKSRLKDKVVSLVLTEWFWIVSEVLAWIIVRTKNSSGEFLLHNTLSPAVFSVIAVLFVLFTSKPVNKKMLVAGYVQMTTVVLLVVVRITDADGVVGGFASLICVAVSMSVCVTTMLFVKPTENNIPDEAAEKQRVSEMEYEYYRIAMENERKTRRMYHDISNYIQTIQALVENGEHAKGIQLMDELNKTFANIRQVVYCDNPVVNIILRTKVEEADKHGIETRITVKDSLKDMQIADIDITKVICNLLDNAIRGCIVSGSSHTKLVIEIYRRNRYLVIRVLNSCDMKLHIESAEKLQSTKNGDRTGGFGMTIVSLTVKKYKGDFEVNAANGLFTATAIMLLE